MQNRFGNLHLVTGPVGSDKGLRVRIGLDRLVSSNFVKEDEFSKRGGKVVVARHPLDVRVGSNRNVEMIGRHKVIVTDSVDDIAESIEAETARIFIVGASHYNEDVADLADALVRSNRQVRIAGLNLDEKGKPFGSISKLMPLAQRVEIAKATCYAVEYGLCDSDEANRTLRLNGPESDTPSCVHHFHNPYYQSALFSGKMRVFTGPMFCGKTEELLSRVNKARKRKEERVAVFVWEKNERYGHNGVTTNNGDPIEGVIPITTGQDILRYIDDNPGITTVFWDEAQFMQDAYDTGFELLRKGKDLSVFGLATGYNRRGFLSFPDIMALANKIYVNQALCMTCHSDATDSQRLDLLASERVGGRSELVKIGGSEEYEARCLDCWVGDESSVLKYDFERFDPHA
jgi:thymidine kinase